MSLLHFSTQLQNHLTAPDVSFARHRNHGYASLQELTSGTRQVVFRYLRGEVQ
ncbi:MAG TPA: hypothetical protein VLE73_05935 [Candidatus Saccharimonadales bacterium]|nr:hypothetical protein [Candidatus Saccharimonadales bacterium]